MSLARPWRTSHTRLRKIRRRSRSMAEHDIAQPPQRCFRGPHGVSAAHARHSGSLWLWPCWLPYCEELHPWLWTPMRPTHG
jgi:hypothetical protein